MPTLTILLDKDELDALESLASVFGMPADVLATEFIQEALDDLENRHGQSGQKACISDIHHTKPMIH